MKSGTRSAVSKGFAQYLSEHSAGGKAELAVIVEEACRLERLTEDLLLYARPSEVRVEEFNLSDLAGEVEEASEGIGASEGWLR